MLALVCVRDADQSLVELVNRALAPIGANALFTCSSVLYEACAAFVAVNTFRSGLAACFGCRLFGSTSRVHRLGLRRCGRGRFRLHGLGRFAGSFATSVAAFLFVSHGEKMLPSKRLFEVLGRIENLSVAKPIRKLRSCRPLSREEAQAS